MRDVVTDYIVKNYMGLMTHAERQAWNGFIHAEKREVRNAAGGAPELEAKLIEGGFLPAPGDDVVANLMAPGAEQFFINVKNRILAEHSDKVFMNYCPVCGILARTPLAKQCPSGHRWSDT